MIINKKKRLRIRERSKSNNEYTPIILKDILINGITLKDNKFGKYVIYNDYFVYAVFRFILNISNYNSLHFQKLQSLLNDVGLSIEKKQKAKEPVQEKKEGQYFFNRNQFRNFLGFGDE